MDSHAPFSDARSIFTILGLLPFTFATTLLIAIARRHIFKLNETTVTLNIFMSSYAHITRWTPLFYFGIYVSLATLPSVNPPIFSLIFISILTVIMAFPALIMGAMLNVIIANAKSANSRWALRPSFMLIIYCLLLLPAYFFYFQLFPSAKDTS